MTRFGFHILSGFPGQLGIQKAVDGFNDQVVATFRGLRATSVMWT